jgi:uncharacterized membrane protein YraQ (UPF0718 family)
MKTKIFVPVFLLFVTSSIFYAQSDYERTQDFKNKYRQIEYAIKSATSINECREIADEIQKLKNDFASSKNLLDKALYPDNFSSAFSKIENNLDVRQKDFSQIVELKAQIDTLQTHVVNLNLKNEELLKQIGVLNARAEKNEADISKLNKLVANLRANIRERDFLVRDLVDSMLVAFVKAPTDMNQKEKQTIIAKAKKNNLFYNVQRTLEDNIQFVKITMMTQRDYSDMKKQQRDFNKKWKQIGSRLSDVYLARKNSKSEITIIDSLFVEWDKEMNSAMWNSVRNLFGEKNIILQPFKNGDEFAASVSSFIDDEIKNVELKGKDNSEKIFKTFADDVYFNTVQHEWIPVLIENNMMTKTNKETIESKIASWKDAVSTSSPNIIYFVVGIIIIGFITFMLIRGKKNNVKPV